MTFKGERWFLIFLLFLGGGWIIISSQLGFIDEGIPLTGFVPLLFSTLFTALVVTRLIVCFRQEGKQTGQNKDQTPAINDNDKKKIFLLVLGLVAAVIMFDLIGALTSIFLLLVYLLGFVENRPIQQALGVSSATSLILFGLFKLWLGVPLPTGPFGF